MNKGYVFHSQRQPHDIPTDYEGKRLPFPDFVGFLFLVGCYGNKCVKSQAEFLLERGYSNIVQLQKLIKGNAELKDKTQILY